MPKMKTKSGAKKRFKLTGTGKIKFGVAYARAADAINDSKRDEEGHFAEEHIIWGVTVNTRTETVTLPEPKIAKVRQVVANPCFDAECTAVALHDIQVLDGMLQYATVACTGLRPEMGAISRLLGHTDGLGTRGP